MFRGLVPHPYESSYYGQGLGEDRYASQRGTSGKLLDSNGYTVGDFELNVPQENRPNLTTEEVSGDHC